MLTLTTKGRNLCFRTLSSIVEGALSSLRGGGTGGVELVLIPTMATRMHGTRKRGLIVMSRINAIPLAMVGDKFHLQAQILYRGNSTTRTRI